MLRVQFFPVTFFSCLALATMSALIVCSIDYGTRVDNRYGTCLANCVTLNYTDCSKVGQPQTCIQINTNLTLVATNETRNLNTSFLVNSILTFSPNCSTFISNYPYPFCSYKVHRLPNTLNFSTYSSYSLNALIAFIIIFSIGTFIFGGLAIGFILSCMA
jgi:hypothetical protein